MALEQETFHWFDYMVFSIILISSCAVGIYYAVTDSKKQTQEEFLMGNRKLKWVPVAISLSVSYNSAISILGKPAEIYLYGVQYFTGIIGISIAIIISVFTFVPFLFKLKLTSTFEYLELRFQSKAVRRVGTLLTVMSELLYVGFAAYAPAVALETVTGLPVFASILCVGAIATFYTSLGGMKAVIWTDTLQSIVMVGGMLAIIISGTYKVDGFHIIWASNKNSGRLNFFDFSINPTVRMSFWSLFAGRLFSFLHAYSVNQAAVQRISSLPTVQKARISILVNLPLQLIWDLLACTVGLVLYSYFSECDPLNHPNPDKHLSSPNQLVPLFVMKVIGWPGIPGLFLAALFSGSLSTVSSCLSSMATVTWEDLLKWKFNNFSDRFKTYILKVIVLLYGMGGIGVAFVATLLQGSVLQATVSFINTANSPMMGLFILGAFFTRTNWLGAVIGSVFGISLPMWMNIGSYLVPATPSLNTSIAECAWNETITLNTTDSVVQPIEGINQLYTLSFLWYPVIGVLTTVLVGIVASVVAGPFIKCIQPGEIKEDYLIFPLDCWSFKKNKPDKSYSVEEEELKNLTL